MARRPKVNTMPPMKLPTSNTDDLTWSLASCGMPKRKETKKGGKYAYTRCVSTVVSRLFKGCPCLIFSLGTFLQEPTTNGLVRLCLFYTSNSHQTGFTILITPNYLFFLWSSPSQVSIQVNPLLAVPIAISTSNLQATVGHYNNFHLSW